MGKWRYAVPMPWPVASASLPHREVGIAFGEQFEGRVDEALTVRDGVAAGLAGHVDILGAARHVARGSTCVSR
ncbi:hypothetical protein GCM10025876_17120 [Demequina litorisediminis]|uniref:Uncharacterized protein n=1 Tax=Demequina litorisediminis TaxID=1849022 RepID=A0ABQ6IFH7_9MICO|nr:hypothetical protein GCM10025876_17120 [Demequina litorisediminis]